MIVFDSRQEIAEFHLPEDSETLSEHPVEFRRDPLTGHTSILARNIVKKRELFFGETDFDLIRELAEKTRNGCFFCPERVETVTPTYPESFIPGGRLRGSRSILFPNLFPLARIHAVATIPQTHFLMPDGFTRDWLADVLLLCGGFIARVHRAFPELPFISINVNHMPPAGASLFHPHFQVFGSEKTPYEIEHHIKLSNAYHEANGIQYWDDLTGTEEALAERWIAGTGRWKWISAFAPRGANEILAVHSRAVSPFDLTADDYSELAGGAAGILGYHHQCGYSSFNCSVTGGVPGSHMRVVVRFITRQNFRAAYRTDDYFLQKFMGAELAVVTPEDLARSVREWF
ncbi:hypothetical protein JXA40_05180 [bacterium]|nr:hypothetical protein [candidate division CSSED10-310 bacterium]